MRKHIFVSKSSQTLLNLTFLEILVNEKIRLFIKLIIKTNELRQGPTFDIFQKAVFCILASSTNLLLNAI